MNRILSVEIESQHGVVTARQRAREIAALLGFDGQDQTRISTAVSEIARNALRYGKGGGAQFFVADGEAGQSLVVRISDHGRGIENLQDILDGRYQSETGMGLGIIGSRRLMDRFEIESKPGAGTVVSMSKLLAHHDRRLRGPDLAKIAEELEQRKPRSAIEEMEHQNRELFATLDQLRRKSEDLARVNHELEDTNRGVLALYAELDQNANHLRRADELKSRFLSNMSHEFRTPVYSTVSICRMLLDESDGSLTSEQERQVSLILRAQEGLADMVNDLLDLAKVEAGKTTARPAEFTAEDLFSALRGMFRPLLTNQNVSLIFEEPLAVPPLVTDEGKIAQILRNFVSNALKFTEAGEVRVSAHWEESADRVILSVTDSGIGLSAEDQGRIFEEFSQIDSRLQRKVRGTGLGLPLSRKLAELLGGVVTVESQPGEGSTFSVYLPRIYPGLEDVSAVSSAVPSIDSLKFPVLVFSDTLQTVLEYERHLKRSRFQLLHVKTLSAARQLLTAVRPIAVVLDGACPGEDVWAFVAQLKREQSQDGIPVLVFSSGETSLGARAIGADSFIAKPVDRKMLLVALEDAAQRQQLEKILLVDDEEISRYILRQVLAETRYVVIEAADGIEGIARARQERPSVIFLDLAMPGMSGFEALRALKNDPLTSAVDVIIYTSHSLTEEQKRRLRSDTLGILSKGDSPEQTPERIWRLLTDRIQNIRKGQLHEA